MVLSQEMEAQVPHHFHSTPQAEKDILNDVARQVTWEPWKFGA